MAALAAVSDNHPPQNLVEKLAAVMAQVERVPKNGWNDFHKYKYATEADITECVRSALASQGVMLIPSVEKNEWRTVKTQKGEETIATLTVRFTITDGKDKIEFNALGEGQDRGDKATYKAMTGAIKYALLKLFLIPTGDDPETEENEKPHTAARPRPTPRAAPAPRSATQGDAAAAAEVLGTAKGSITAAQLWDEAGREFGEKDREAQWRGARVKVFGAGVTPPSSKEWTQEQINAMEAALFPKPPPAGTDDIPF